MSRYYSIELGPSGSSDQAAAAQSPDPASGAATGAAGVKFTNQVDGRCDPNAWRVELDVPSYGFAAPAGQAFVRVWGVTLQQISQASDFNGQPIKVTAGMQAGLPLASKQAAQAGVILEGTVFQAFGNWLGVNQILDLVVTVDAGATQDAPVNITLNWTNGTSLSDAVTSTLTGAYPGYKVKVNISGDLVLPADECGYYQTIEQFAQYVKGVSQDIVGGDYPGVDIVLGANKTFNVYDGTSPTDPKEVAFEDLVGQITWLGAFEVQFTTVMRGDLACGDSVTFPPALALQTTTTPASQSQARDKATFAGSWTIIYERHVGDSRSADAQAWVSTFQAISAQAPQSSTGVGDTSS